MNEGYDIKSKIKKASDPVEKIKLRIEYAHKVRFTDPDEAFEIAKTAWEEAKGIEDTILELKSLVTICSSFVPTNQFDKLEEWTSILKQRAEETGNNTGMARANLFQYAICNHHGQHLEAEKHLKKALEYFDAAKNYQGKTTCFMSLGNMKFHKKHYDEAYKYYQSALDIIPEENDEIGTILRQNIAAVHFMKKDYLEAWKVYQALLDEIPDGELGTKALIFLNLGSVSLKTQEYASAIEYFEKAISFTMNSQKSEIHIKANSLKAESLIEMGKTQEAYKILIETENNTKDLKNLYLLEELYHAFILYYQVQKNTEKIEEYQRKLENIDN